GTLFPLSRAGVPLARKGLGALREAVGWTTGGISEVPTLIKGGAKGVGKLVEAKAAKPLEKTMTPAQARAAKGIGVKPTITAAEEIPTAVGAPLGREAEYLKGAFEERFIPGRAPLEPIGAKVGPEIDFIPLKKGHAKVFKNPTKEEISEVLADSKDNVVRFMVSEDGTTVYAWDAFDLTHDDIMKKYGIKDYSGSGTLTSQGQIKTYGVFPEAPKAPLGPPTTTLRAGIPLHKIGEVGKAYEKHIGAPIWDKAIMKGIPKALEKVPGGKAVNRMFLREYRGNLPNTEKYIKSIDERARFQAVGREYGLDLGKRLQQF
ncbi:unnamed protein product, partial [marine sediment metagenome]